MRIACLQFSPVLGDIDNNLNRADAVLSRANPKDLDLLVLPELAFTGYNFKSLQHISPYLEPTTSGITSLWARTTALKHECVVTVGYPEKVDITPRWPANPEYYNSAITVNSEGETIANYRKSFLYYTDETWALEGPDGFYDGEIEGLGNVAMGICMDLNPYKFETPWSAWEFAYHVLHKQANLVILSMAWRTREDARSYSRAPKDPDMETLSYWLARLEPIIRAEDEGEIIVVIANRCGTEEDAVYAGTSAILGIEDGEVKVYGILGRGERELLVVDTDQPPQAKLVAEPASTVEYDHSKSQIAIPPPPPPLALPEKANTKHVNHVTSIDEILFVATPISPVEPMFSHSYFADLAPKKEDIQAALMSSVHTKRDHTPAPADPRPTSPKSRNASRTRIAIHQQPALISQDLINEPAIIPNITVGYSEKILPYSASDAVPENTWGGGYSLTPAQKEASMSPRPKSTGW